MIVKKKHSLTPKYHKYQQIKAEKQSHNNLNVLAMANRDHYKVASQLKIQLEFPNNCIGFQRKYLWLANNMLKYIQNSKN